MTQKKPFVQCIEQIPTKIVQCAEQISHKSVQYVKQMGNFKPIHRIQIYAQDVMIDQVTFSALYT